MVGSLASSISASSETSAPENSPTQHSLSPDGPDTSNESGLSQPVEGNSPTLLPPNGGQGLPKIHPKHGYDREHGTIATDAEQSISAGSTLSAAVKSWILEILAVLLATGLLIACFVILHIFNGKRTTTWEAPISLSALIATLSTLGRIALGMVVSEIVSQNKWPWFATGRPLYDMERLDQASRGPWGAIILLGKSLQKPHLVVALVVALTSIAMGPFAQQAVGFTECDYVEESKGASIPNIRTFGNIPLSGRYAFANKSTGPPRAESFNGGVFDGAAQIKAMLSLRDPTANDTDSIVLGSCPAGNCSFTVLEDDKGVSFTHRSLGLCSQCIDISALIKYNRDTPYRNTTQWTSQPRNMSQWSLESWRLPRGHRLEYESESTASGRMATFDIPLLNLSTTDSSFWEVLRLENQTPFSQAAAHSLTNVTFLSLSNLSVANGRGSVLNSSVEEGTNQSATATTCTLYPCLKSYFASMSGGRLTENLVSTEKLVPYADVDTRWNDGSFTLTYPSDLVLVRPPCLVDGEVYTLKNMSTARGAVTLQRWFGSNITSALWLHPNGSNASPSVPSWMQAKEWKSDARPLNIIAPPQCLYAMAFDGEWRYDFKYMLDVILHGTCWLNKYRDMGRSQGSEPGICRQTYDVGQAYQARIGLPASWLEGLARLPRRSQQELSVYMDSFAESLTRKLRMGAFQVPGRALPGNEWRADSASEDVVGKVTSTTTCFTVDWRWLMLSTSLTALTAGVLAWTVVCGRGGVVWKSSILPLLYYRDRISVVDRAGDSDEAMSIWSPDRPLLGISEIQADAKRARVVFAESSD